MTRNVIVVPPEITLKTAWLIMSRERIRHLPVVRAGALIGMISDRDVLAHSTVMDDDSIMAPANVLVAEAMTQAPLETCEEGTSVSHVARRMIELKIDAIPVVLGLRLVGLVTSTDLLELLVEQREALPIPFKFTLIEDTRAYAS